MPKVESIIKKLGAIIPEEAACRDDSFKTGVVYSARVDLVKLRDALACFKEEEWYLESVTALDFQDTAELVYHMNCYEPKSRVALRLLCGHDQSPPSVHDIFPTADWQEREIHEFFGIKFSGHPNLKPLLLPEDADYHPLKKSFGIVNAYRKREEVYG